MMSSTQHVNWREYLVTTGLMCNLGQELARIRTRALNPFLDRASCNVETEPL
jgi:hypothetical protein